MDIAIAAIRALLATAMTLLLAYGGFLIAVWAWEWRYGLVVMLTVPVFAFWFVVASHKPPPNECL